MRKFKPKRFNLPTNEFRSKVRRKLRRIRRLNRYVKVKQKFRLTIVMTIIIMVRLTMLLMQMKVETGIMKRARSYVRRHRRRAILIS